MEIKALVKEYISHSVDFYSDSELPDVDDKHSAIVAKAYAEINDFDFENFRNWAGQGDLGAPSQLSFDALKVNGWKRTTLRFIYRKLFRRKSEQMLIQGLLDDIALIKLIHADDLMRENPVHTTPGVGDFYKVNGVTVNVRWLRYVYFAKRILDLNVLGQGGVWVDVGSYYGGLQGIVRKYCPRSRIVLVDFNHQLCRSYIYMSSLYPEANHVLPDQFEEFSSFLEFPEGSIIYVPVTQFDDISSQSVDLATNFFSFGEMRRSIFDQYLDSEIFSKAAKQFIVNRFVSAPFFEKTYDTDLTIIDYLRSDRSLDYFDVCPIHHYMLVERELFGRYGPRNISSPYFEIISSRK